jgi:thiamine biosynthesis lipoprotein
MISGFNRSYYTITTVALFIIMESCQPAKKPYIHLECQAQGTTFSIKYQDARQRNFSSTVDSLFHVIDKSMSLWDSLSMISRVNRNEDIEVDHHFRKVFEKSMAVAQATNGAFDVTVGPLVKAWGFGAKPGGKLPDSSQVDSLKKLIGFQKVHLHENTVIKDDPGIMLDFNAIAQGYTVDVMAKYLTENGIENYLVEIGGEVRASGVNDRGETWQVGIDKPVDSTGVNRPLQTTLPLANKSLATSGSYRKYIRNGGKRLGHIIDPSTGYPVSDHLISVSVIAGDCMTADAFATAFLVMGMEKSLALAKEKGFELFLIYEDEHGKLKTASTPGFPE